MVKNSNAGFTLIEVVLAIAILAIALVPIFGYMINSQSVITHADRREKALILAQQELERIKNMDYDDIVDTIIADIDYTDPDLNLDKYPEYTRTLEKPIPEYESIMKTIIITVSWGDPNEHSVTLKTRVAKR